MDTDLIHSRRTLSKTPWILLLVPALLVSACTRKREHQIQTSTIASAETMGTSAGGLDTGRAPSPPVFANPTEVRISDGGRTFTYHVGDTFTVLLDGNSYPQAQLSFEPGGVITLGSSAPPATAPNYAAEFEAVAPGEVVLKNGTFVVTIRVVS